MKKALLALTIAAISGTAMAQLPDFLGNRHLQTNAEKCRFERKTQSTKKHRFPCRYAV